MKIYKKGNFIYVDLEGEKEVTSILNEAPNVIVKGEKLTKDGLCAVCNKPANYHEDHDYVAPLSTE